MWKIPVRTKERRRAQRITTRHLVKYSLMDPEGRLSPVISVSKNVSTTGLLIQTKEPLPVGKQFELEINFPPFKVPIKAQVKAVWTKQLKNKIYYRSGLSFVNIDKEHRQRIIDYIEYVNRITRDRLLLSQLKRIIFKILTPKPKSS